MNRSKRILFSLITTSLTAGCFFNPAIVSCSCSNKPDPKPEKNFRVYGGTGGNITLTSNTWFDANKEWLLFDGTNVIGQNVVYSIDYLNVPNQK